MSTGTSDGLISNSQVDNHVRNLSLHYSSLTRNQYVSYICFTLSLMPIQNKWKPLLLSFIPQPETTINKLEIFAIHEIPDNAPGFTIQ